MPPRLPIPSVGTALARSFIRPFSSSAPVAAPPRDNFSAQFNNRLSNLNNHNHDRTNSHARDRGASSGKTGHNQRGDAASRMLDRYKTKAESRLRERTAQLQGFKNQQVSNDYLKQMPRRWHAGDVYSPHDLSPIEMQKWRKRSLRNVDVVDTLGINPLDMYKV
jgi:small subunit ribosomal protein S18